MFHGFPVQWSNSMMHGCGAKITKQPNGSFLAEEGQFVNDEWVSLEQLALADCHCRSRASWLPDEHAVLQGAITVAPIRALPSLPACR